MENKKTDIHPVPDIDKMIKELGQIAREKEWHVYNKSFIPGYTDERKNPRSKRE